MRIGLVIYGSLDSLSGGYLYDRKLVEWLRRCGDELAIISLPDRGYLLNLLANLSPDWVQKVRDLQLDLLLQDELNHPSLFWRNRQLKRTTKMPLVAIVHHLRHSEQHPAWLRAWYGLVEARFLRTVDTFIFNSQTTRSSVEGLLGRPVGGIIAHPAGDRLGKTADAAAIARRLDNPGPRRLLFLGNIIPRKGLHDLVGALAACRRPDWHLTVAGSLTANPAYVRRIKRQIRVAGLSGRVDFLGSVPDSDLRQLLENHDILTLPSQYEGFGIAYLEAMCFGLPAVACREGAASEIITHRTNGILVPSGDRRALTFELSRLLGDRAGLLAMSLAARQRYGEFAGWDKSMQAIRLFLLKILNQAEDRS